MQGPLITLIEENDDFALNGDQHYTQGMKLSYLYGDEQIPNWAYALAHNVPDLGMSIETPRFGYTVGQSIYTPRNIRSPVALTYDRPYEGWLYFGMILERQGKQGGVPVNDTFEVDLGFIGPESFAAQAQAWWHTVGGWIVPKGWGNQLNTEPAIDIKYSRQWKFSTVSQGVGLELIPNAGFSLGNVMTYAGAGALVRFGYNIPNDFGPQTIDSLAHPTGSTTREASIWLVMSSPVPMAARLGAGLPLESIPAESSRCEGTACCRFQSGNRVRFPALRYRRFIRATHP